MCANFIYDLNGKKGPNTVGKDIGFMTAFYPTDSQVVAPNPIKIEDAYNDDRFRPESFCKKKHGEDARAANIEELKSLFVNLFLIYPAGYNNGIYPKNGPSETAYYLMFHSGSLVRDITLLNHKLYYCIK